MASIIKRKKAYSLVYYYTDANGEQKQKWETIPVEEAQSGHGGGDTGIMVDILSLLRGETPTDSVCDVRVSYENHLAGFAAEESRLTNQVINLKAYEESI